MGVGCEETCTGGGGRGLLIVTSVLWYENNPYAHLAVVPQSRLERKCADQPRLINRFAQGEMEVETYPYWWKDLGCLERCHL